jgi:CubicO group peptidase (beta-lactamase class C family)
MSCSIQPKSHKVTWVCSALIALAGCSSDKPAATNPTETSGAGGQVASAGAGATHAAGSGTGTTGAAGNTAAAGSGGRSAAGNGAAGAAAGTGASGAPSSNPAGAGTTGATGMMGQPAPMDRPKECRGLTLPPRAIGTNGPFMVGPEAGGLPAYWPTTDWKTEMPDKLGFDPAKLMAAADFKTQFSNTQAVFVVRHGYVALEKYSGGQSATSTHESYSMAKSFASGLIGIAISEGKIPSTDKKICETYPMQWDCSDTRDPRSRITIEHSMNLTTGLRWTEDWRSTASGTNDAYSVNMLDTVLARESVEEPGKTKRYSTGDPALLSGVLQEATGMTAYAYGKAKVFDVIGASSIRWNADNMMRTTTYAGLQASARDYARYGYLYLRRGEWDGKQVIPADWVDRTTIAKNPCEDWNQWLWHINLPTRLGTQDPACAGLFCLPTEYANLPPDGFMAEGVNGQFVIVIPSADLVIVRLASDQAGSDHWDDFARGFIGAMLDAIN